MMHKLIIALSALSAFNVFACTCDYSLPSEYVQEAENILYGRVVGINILKDNEGKEYQKVTFENPEILKGSSDPVALAYFHNYQDSTCDGRDFKLKTHFIAFTDNNGWITGFCGGTEPIYENIGLSKRYLEDIVKSLPNKQINQDK